jgi:predicted nucleic acid-binding protein
MRAVFVDTSYFIALVNRQDAHHHLAKEWARKLVKERILCHTCIPILFELADGFARLGRRQIGISLIENIVNSENYVLHAFRVTSCSSRLSSYPHILYPQNFVSRILHIVYTSTKSGIPVKGNSTPVPDEAIIQKNFSLHYSALSAK